MFTCMKIYMSIQKMLALIIFKTLFPLFNLYSLSVPFENSKAVIKEFCPEAAALQFIGSFLFLLQDRLTGENL
jgi:hypothetical protein